IQKDVLRFQGETVVFIMKGLAAPIAHDGPNLILGRLELSRSLRLHENHNRTGAGKCTARDIQTKILLISCEWNVDAVIAGNPKEFPQRLQHAENLINLPAGPDILAHHLID